MNEEKEAGAPNRQSQSARSSHEAGRIVAEWAFAVVAALLWLVTFCLVGTMERMPDPVGGLWAALGGVWHALTWGWA